ncbi:MAG TPA: YgiQ family radical SAM protein, partial [Spirochaetales bacterium]|nr:YgiQ family radical SAM protein [Spirochaetales bacterium]
MSFLPTTRAELAARRLDGLDFVIVTADAYVDHPSFGAALIGRRLERLGYSVGVIARPDPTDVEAFRALGRPSLAFLVAGGAIDSMVCKYTANRKPRSTDE